jgi:hypothetical protein
MINWIILLAIWGLAYITFGAGVSEVVANLGFGCAVVLTITDRTITVPDSILECLVPVIVGLIIGFTVNSLAICLAPMIIGLYLAARKPL